MANPQHNAVTTEGSKVARRAGMLSPRLIAKFITPYKGPMSSNPNWIGVQANSAALPQAEYK